MENTKKPFLRSTKQQIKYINTYMQQNPNFAAGEYKTPLGAAQNYKEWGRLKAALDELGPHRSIEQWKVCWRDQKKKARAEKAALERAKKSTGNCVQLPELSSNAELVLSAIGSEMAVGVGPAESPIGLTLASTTPLPALAPEEQPSTSAGHCSQPSTSAEPAPAPRASGHRPRRVRRVLPPERFISAQQELNDLVKGIARGLDELRQGINNFHREVVDELRRSNDIRHAKLQLLLACTQNNENEQTDFL